MEKNRFIRLLFFLQIFILISGCIEDTQKNQDYYIVEMTGVEFAFTPSRAGFEFGSAVWAEEDTLSIAVSNGELIGVNTLEENEAYFRYDPDDGLLLSFSDDTLYEIVYLNDEIVSLDLSGKSKAWEWVEQNDAKEFWSVRQIYVDEPLSESRLKSLEKIAEIIPNPGLIIDNDTAAQDVLRLFSPEWLAVEDINFNNIPENIKSNLRDLELVWFVDFDPSYIEFLYGLTDLHSLTIQDLDSAVFSEIRFDKLTGLRTLSIVGSQIYDLSPIDTLQQLKDLNLVFCGPFENIGPLAGLTELKSLGLTGCEDIKDVSVVEELPALTRLSLPTFINNEEFAGILEKQTKLQLLELVFVEDTLDLGPLSVYTGLKALSIGPGITDFTPLYQLKDLELMVLDEMHYEDSLGMVELRNAMPGTRFVQGGGFCLGSGWILLLFPSILLIVLFRSIRIKFNFSRT